jgi:predicted Zn-dependent protease with MMP-like domain
MDRLKFEKLVAQAIEQLPPEFREKLENVAIIVEDRPSAELLEQMEIPAGDTLFGLYEGTPLTERGFQTPLHPDRIWIFQQPIEAECRTEQ